MLYTSEITGKSYKTIEELEADELIISEQEQKSQQAREARKAKAAKAKEEDAKVVEDAFKERNTASLEYDTKVRAARKAYNEALVAARKAFEEAVADATKVKNAAEEAFDTALKEFTKKHSSYHMTLKDGDNEMTISGQSDNTANVIGKEYNSILDFLINLWK